MPKIINESGMNFIADNSFHIEKSDAYAKLKYNSIKTVEFIRAKKDKLLFVEAKSDFPDFNNSNPHNMKNFNNKIGDICDKFVHSLNVYSSIKTGVNETVFSEDFNVPDKISVSFVLVIKNNELDCKPISTKLEQSLPYYLRQIWNPDVLVINQEMAIKQNLIINGGA